MSRALRIGVLVGLLVALVVVMWPEPRPTPTVEEQAEAIADRLRCPYCNGESIADAPSGIARDLQDFIREELAAGRTESEIRAFFVGRYGEQVLLDPPLSGWGVWLWVLPLAVLGAGTYMIARRLRGTGPGRPVAAGALPEQLAAIDADLAELEAQVAVGELDAADAARLRDTYRREAEELRAAPIREDVAPSRRRLVAGAAVLLVGAGALTWGVVTVADDRAPNGLITGADPLRSLEDVTDEEMELVVAENPDVVGMRLALAGRYFEKGDFSAALPHYLYILERHQNAEALANVGWMAFLSGEGDTAQAYVERSLTVDPDHLQSYWFLANIRISRGDAEGAIDPLRILLSADGVPEDIREQARELLEAAEAAA